MTPEQNAVLRALFSIIHLRDDYSSIWISDLTLTVNSFLHAAGESLRLLPRKVGAVLTSLGFTARTRTSSGWTVSLNRADAEKLHQLAECYGIDGLRDRFLSIPPDDCALCQAAGLNKKGADLAPRCLEGKQSFTDVDLRKELSL